MLFEIALHQLSLLANRASPGMALLELAMNQAELLKRLQQIHWQQVVEHMEHQPQALW